MRTLEEARAYQKQEKSADTAELWEAILAAHDAIIAAGGSGLPERHVSIARANLVRAGKVQSGDFTDAELTEMATADGVRVWAADMGAIFKNEPVIGPEDQEVYICLTQHQAQAGWAPGTIGGRTLFRLLRQEPEEPGVYLDFAWGEHVPYGAVRRDPTNNLLYTPIKQAGVTLYEPHYPSLVPSEYKLYEEPDTPEPEPAPEPEPEPTPEPTPEPEPEPTPEPTPSDVPDWNDLEAGHQFNIGDHFTYNGVEYEVLRVFQRYDNWAPPALLNDYYQVANAE